MVASEVHGGYRRPNRERCDGPATSNRTKTKAGTKPSTIGFGGEDHDPQIIGGGD
jgi:hypothetical protein